MLAKHETSAFHEQMLVDIVAGDSHTNERSKPLHRALEDGN